MLNNLILITIIVANLVMGYLNYLISRYMELTEAQEIQRVGLQFVWHGWSCYAVYSILFGDVS